MLIEKRFREILEIVNREKSVTVQELMNVLNASESTIRRDLNTLDKEGRLLKVHGGAVAVEGVFNGADSEMRIRQEINTEDKSVIAAYAASLIEDNDFIYLDAGTTTEKITECIKAKNVVFVTNSLVNAKKLAQNGYKSYILGGEFKARTEAVIGSEAIESLSKYNFTKGFFGANGITRKEGLSTPDAKEAAVKKKAMERCAEKYILADRSKFSKISPITFAGFDEAIIITVGPADKAFKDCTNILEV